MAHHGPSQRLSPWISQNITREHVFREVVGAQEYFHHPQPKPAASQNNCSTMRLGCDLGCQPHHLGIPEFHRWEEKLRYPWYCLCRTLTKLDLYPKALGSTMEKKWVTPCYWFRSVLTQNFCIMLRQWASQPQKISEESRTTEPGYAQICQSSSTFVAVGTLLALGPKLRLTLGTVFRMMDGP